MAGTGWQSADLLIRFNQLAGRPSADAIPDTTKYLWLADAQDAVIVKISGIVGRAMYGAPQAMTTADGGLTWTFGVDGNGYPCVPLSARIYPSLSAIPSYPWSPGQDYLDEGATIRMPNGTPYTGTLFWQGITPPQQISATVQPVLSPPPARILIVINAVQGFAAQGSRNVTLVDDMQLRWDREFPEQMTAIRKHLRGSRLGFREQFFPIRLGV